VPGYCSRSCWRDRAPPGDRTGTQATSAVAAQAEIVLDTIRIRNENYRRTHPDERGSRTFEEPPLTPITPTFRKAAEMFEAQKKAIGNPTRLVLIDIGAHTYLFPSFAELYSWDTYRA
jgi:hypothetical protein